MPLNKNKSRDSPARRMIMENRLYRVAISDHSSDCLFCSGLDPDEWLEGDYCPHCQYVYNSLTSVREYADYTVSYHETKEEADAMEASLVPYRIRRQEDHNAYTISAHVSGVIQNSPEFLGGAWNAEYKTLEEAIDVAIDLEGSLEEYGLPAETVYEIFQDGGSIPVWSTAW